MNWIKCSEKMPQNGERVLTLEGRTVYTSFYDDGGWSFPYPINPSHWMPIPLPPEDL